MKTFFTSILFQPLFNALILLYLIYPDLGVAIILLTVIIRLILLPISKKSIESQKKMQEIQPELKKIQAKYKHDRQLQGQKVMAFYKEKKVNPAGGCLPMIIQVIILIALYRVFMLGLKNQGTDHLFYSFINNPGMLNTSFLGLIDLAKPHIPLAILAAGLQFIQGKMMAKKSQKETTKKNTSPDSKEPDFSSLLQQQMVYMAPLLTLFIGIKFPSGLILYWIVTTIFAIVQQYLIIKKETGKGFWQTIQGI